MKIQKSGIGLAGRIFKPVIVVVFLATASLFLYSCGGEVEKIKPFSSPENLPVLSAVDFETTFIDSLKIQFYMKAPVLEKYEVEGQPYLEFPKGILLVKYATDGKIISRITSDYARQYEKEKRWEAKNNVVAVNYDGDTLKTEHLIWEERAGRIYSDKFVKFILPDKIFMGNEFESEQNFQNWVIKDITGIIYVDDKKNPMPEEKPLEPKATEDKKVLKFEN
jgi:LPS export ABC transporter protein LptC